MKALFRHTGIAVFDLDRALSFWTGTLGFTVHRRLEESGRILDTVLGLSDVRVTTVKLADANGNLVELLRFHSHPGAESWQGSPTSTGLTHIALTVDDINATCRLLEKNGATLLAAPQQTADGLAKVTFCRGPEGLLLELVEVLAS